METFHPEAFGKYFLVDRIATGGMAEIFKAKTFAAGGFENLVALKRVRAELSESPGFVEMFVDEARVTASLQHPNVVRVYDFGRIGANFYLVMEHVDGRDLHQVLRAVSRAGERVPPTFAAWIILAACKGLHYAHTRTDAQGQLLGLVHRDVSPGNLLLSFDGDVKVADFGIAHARGSLTAKTDDAIGGTAAYMAPEGLDGGAVDRRADVFGLGVILYEMVTGRRAFRGADEAETLARLRAGELPRPIKVDASVSEVLDAVVMRAVAHDPAARFATARDLGDALRAAVLAGTTEDAVRESFASWLQGLFAEDIAADKVRLAESTAAALEMLRAREQAERAARAERLRVTRLRGVLAVVAVALGLVVVGVAKVWLVPPTVPTVAMAATGSVVVDVDPGARVSVGGVARGTGTHVEVDGLVPGTYEVRLEADGRDASVETVRVTGGGRTRVERTLAAAPPPAPEPGSREARQAEAAARAAARTAATDAVANHNSVTPKRTSARGVAGGEGALRVVLGGGAAWANVWVDGKKLPRTAPFSGVVLSAGKHTIRVANDAVGLDHSEAVDVTAGGSVTVRATPP